MTANFPNDTTLRGIHMICYQSFTERPAIGRGIYNVYDSNQFREHSLTFGGIGTFDTKSEGEAVNYTSPVEGFLQTFTHTTYAKGLRITMEQWSDDMYGVMEDSPAELGMSAYSTEEILLSNHFNNGFSGTTGPDGLSLFSTVHLREDGATYRNELSTASDLSLTTLETALIDFRDFRSGGGRRLQIQPKVLLVPPALQFTASKLLESSNIPQHAPGSTSTVFTDGSINPVNDLGLRIVVWDYLTDADAWFILADKSDHRLCLYEREPFTTSDVFDFDTGDIKFKGVFRQSSGWADPRGVFGTPGSG